MARTDPRPHYGTKRRAGAGGYIYVWVPGHPTARHDGYASEHRYIAWEAGLLTDLAHQVHHRNERKTDNRLENLVVLDPSAHALHHAEDRGTVRNQHGVWAVKPRELRASAPRPGDRVCEGCGGVIPEDLRRDARYCSERCRVNHWKRTHPRR